jgi:hypothetical protein
MALDYQALKRLRRYEDPEAGIFEEFSERRLGPGRALALLSGPLGEVRLPAWVVCPTIGFEHGNLRRMEAIVARRLSAAGFPVLRIRPDTSPLHGEVALPLRITEVEEAVELLGGSVGLIGVLFGGTVGALVAERLGATALALIEPVTRGRQYARELVRREAVAKLMGPEEGDGAGPMRQLSTTGHVYIRGLKLTHEAFEAISRVNLATDLHTFDGRSLLIGISPSGVPSPALRKLQEHLEGLGGDVTVETIEDPLYAPLGDYYYRDAGLLRIDTRLEVDRRVANALARWGPGSAP